MPTKFVIKKNTLTPGLKGLKKLNIDTREKALVKAGLQGLNWMVNGSPKLSLVPPILTGMLRGSGSLFIGSKFISATPDSSGKGTPVTAYNGKSNTITWIFNTDYAARLHETKWKPGPKAEPNVGNKWIRKHLQADKELILDFIAKIYREAF